MLEQRTIVRICALIIVFFCLFLFVAIASDDRYSNSGLIGTAAKMEFAFSWTLRMAGILIAIISAIHLVRFAGQRQFAEYVAPGGVALLGGLMLLGQQQWWFVTAFAVVLVAFIVQQLILSRAAAPTAVSTTVAEQRNPG